MIFDLFWRFVLISLLAFGGGGGAAARRAPSGA
jgi:chromate transport protein ChrA